MRPQRLGLYSSVRTRSRPLDCWSNPARAAQFANCADLDSAPPSERWQPRGRKAGAARRWWAALIYEKNLSIFQKTSPGGASEWACGLLQYSHRLIRSTQSNPKTKARRFLGKKTPCFCLERNSRSAIRIYG